MFKQRPSSLPVAPTESVSSGPSESQVIRHWQQRLFKNSYTRAGRRFALKRWSVKIQHAGRRHTFSLAARAKPAAAVEARSLHDMIVAEGWEAVLRRHSSRSAGNGDFPKTDPRYWRQRLLLRRHPLPAAYKSAEDLTVRVEHAGVAHFFPLGTTDQDVAAERAQQIYHTIVAKGWKAACGTFPREVTVGFEWSANPLMWTYMTLHTMINAPTVAPLPPPSLSPLHLACGEGGGGGRGGLINASRGNLPMGRASISRVLLLESDTGISRALSWAIHQQAGFTGFICDSAESLPRALTRHQPHLILANHLLAEQCGISADSELPTTSSEATMVTYSVYVDSDQLFLATPGGVGVYLLNRVEPANLLAPLLNDIGEPGLSADEISRRVQNYFKGLLQPPAPRGTSGLARLTRRERDVLALLSKGYIDKEIAPALRISTWTVRGHIKKIFERLNVHTRTEAVVQYLER